MKTISRLAKQYNISRSTLLYYDSIGLLTASTRNDSGYRIYSQDDCDRLAQIRLYRDTGLSLQQISNLLKKTDTGTSTQQLLHDRLHHINEEITALRQQQQTICSILNVDLPTLNPNSMDKQRWTQILQSAGFDDEDMRKWHMEFERQAPEAHQEFLESLNIKPDQIKSIRQWSSQID